MIKIDHLIVIENDFENKNYCKQILCALYSVQYLNVSKTILKTITTCTKRTELSELI
jgi:hypothetical protein